MSRQLRMAPQDQSNDCCRDPGQQFPMTQWTLVLRAGGAEGEDRDAALERFCRAYWFPLYAFARRRGHSPHESEDLVQEYFARLIRNDLLGGVERGSGKFRTFLLTTFKYFLTNEWYKATAKKRGNGLRAISIDDDAEGRYAAHVASNATPELLFQQQWAATILERVFKRLETEFKATGKSEVFDALRGCLPGADGNESYAEAGARLNVSPAAVRMAAHRMRQRYRAILRAEIAVTVSSPQEIDPEIRELVQCLTPL